MADTLISEEDHIGRLVADAHALLDEAIGREVKGANRCLAGVVVLFSGGNDSTTLAHLFKDRATHAAHANTGIGIEQTRQYVRDTCAGWGLPLIEAYPRIGETYRDLVLGRVRVQSGPSKGKTPYPGGFPGPAMHYLMFQRLKERALESVRRELVEYPYQQRVVFLAGRRASESDRRKGLALKDPIERKGSTVWVSPLVNWTKADLNAYRRIHPDVPRNEVSDLLHMSGECLCLAPDALVSTEQGWRPIADVNVGDRVHSREEDGLVLRPVVRVFHNDPKPMLRVKPYFLLPVDATGNHPFWVRDYRHRMRLAETPISAPRWAEARELHGAYESNRAVSVSKQRKHYIGYPFRTDEVPLGLSESALRLLGYFVAEGAYQYRKDAYRDGIAGIVFTVSWKSREMAEDIADCINEVFGARAGWREYADKRTGREFIMVRAGRREASDFVARYTHGRYCHEKTLSESVMTATLAEQRTILAAMWLGDGSEFTRKRNGRVEHVSAYGTTSRGLALQVQEMLLRRGEIYGINSGQASKRPSYLVRRSGSPRNAFIDADSGVLWTGIQSITESPAQPTFNLQIAGEPNFRTEAGLVHNCGSFAHADELEEIEMWFPEVAAEIRQLEKEVAEAGLDIPRERCKWGWGAGKEAPSKVGALCSSCDARFEQLSLIETEA